MDKKNIWIIGGGMGRFGLLTEEARKAIQRCGRVYTSQRLYDRLSSAYPNLVPAAVTEYEELLFESEEENTGLLVSGDPGFFSFAAKRSEKLEECATLHVICGVNSLQYLCAKLRIPYEEIKVISLHGHNKSPLGPVSYNRRVFCLTGGGGGVAKLLHTLCGHGLSEVFVTVGQDLSEETERIVRGKAKDLLNVEFSHLAVMLIENENCADPLRPLPDDDFIRGKVPMTKEEVRALSVYKLSPQKGDIVYDVGAGTGSVSVALAGRASDGLVYAVEREEEALRLIHENIIKFCAHNVIPIAGKAPEAFDALLPPDKAFIGGNSGRLREIIQALADQNPRVRITITAVTLRTLSEGTAIFKEMGYKTDVTLIQSSRVRQACGAGMMEANNPVYIITGEKNEQDQPD